MADDASQQPSSGIIPPPPASGAPEPIPAPPPAVPNPIAATRQRDIERAVALRNERMRLEQERSRKRTEHREHIAEEAEQAVRRAAEEKKEARRERKAFRTMMNERELGIQADKERREKLQKFADEQQRIQSEKKKKNDRYMHEVHETARLKQAMLEQQKMKKAERDREVQRIEFDYRTAVEEAAKARRHRREQAERDFHARRSILDNELRSLLYQEEGKHRTHLQAIDADRNHKLSLVHAGSDFRMAEQEREEVRTTAQLQQAKADGAYKDRRMAVEAETARKRRDLEERWRGEEACADSAERTAVTTAHREREHGLEDVRQKYKGIDRLIR